MTFEVGDRVQWHSHGVLKLGVVVGVLPPWHKPNVRKLCVKHFATSRICTSNTRGRKAQSYVVHVIEEQPGARGRIYWPVTSQLNPVKLENGRVVPQKDQNKCASTS